MRLGLRSRPDPDDDDGLFDRIDAVRLLRADDESKGAILEELAGVGAPEHDIVGELGGEEPVPLAHPERFDAAHRKAMRALEVLERNGTRGAELPRRGPITPLAAAVVSMITRMIVRGHLNALTGRILGLYTAREATAVAGSPERRMLRGARIQAGLMEERLRGRPFALPTFLLGGAVLSTALSQLQGELRSAVESPVVAVVGAALTLTILAGLAWCALYSAGVARRRIRLSTDRPVAELWEAIGRCGPPPEDQSRAFALWGIALTAIAWVGVPVAAWLLFG